MKLIYKILYASLLLCCGIIISCDKNDSDIKWGDAKIYMPQASLLNGGLTNDYPVPFNTSFSTKNYQFDSATGILNIDLGVYRSGLEQLEAFSVSIKANIDSTEAAATKIPKGLALSSDYFSLPEQVSVGAGKREQSFSLSVDLKKLVASSPSVVSKRLVLVVEISNPTRYSINQNLSKTAVIINTASFLDPVNLIKGGEMNDEDKQYWTVAHLIPNDPAKFEISGGVLNMSSGSTSKYVRSNTAIYQAIEVEAGIVYQLKADLNSTGGTICSFEMHINKEMPITGTPYNHLSSADIFAYSDDWGGVLGNGGFSNPKSGQLTKQTGWNNLIKSDGEFTATMTGTMYVVFKVDCYGNMGDIKIDNVSIYEK